MLENDNSSSANPVASMHHAVPRVQALMQSSCQSARRNSQAERFEES
jgi:hypothetical protein